MMLEEEVEDEDGGVDVDEEEEGGKEVMLELEGGGAGGGVVVVRESFALEEVPESAPISLVGGRGGGGGIFGMGGRFGIMMSGLGEDRVYKGQEDVLKISTLRTPKKRSAVKEWVGGGGGGGVEEMEEVVIISKEMQEESPREIVRRLQLQAKEAMRVATAAVVASGVVVSPTNRKSVGFDMGADVGIANIHVLSDDVEEGESAGNWRGPLLRSHDGSKIREIAE
jgi:hypothetical protein